MNVKLVEIFADGRIYRKFDAKVLSFPDSQTAEIIVDDYKLMVPVYSLEDAEGNPVNSQ